MPNSEDMDKDLSNLANGLLRTSPMNGLVNTAGHAASCSGRPLPRLHLGLTGEQYLADLEPRA